jgi:hypothetical protein
MFRLGLHVCRRDAAEARRLWLASCARGYLPAAVKLARQARKGRVRGVWNETRFLMRAADLGSGYSAYYLGAYWSPGPFRKKYWERAKDLGVDPADQSPITSRWIWQRR